MAAVGTIFNVFIYDRESNLLPFRQQLEDNLPVAGNWALDNALTLKQQTP